MMKEKLQEYALLAEIIGGIAIVASLIFVGLQVQQNTEALRISTGDMALESFNAIRTMTIENSEVAEITSKVRNGDELTDVERIREIALCQSNVWASAQLYSRYLAYNEDETATGVISSFKRSIANNEYSCWESLKSAMSTQGFESFVKAVELN